MRRELEHLCSLVGYYTPATRCINGQGSKLYRRTRLDEHDRCGEDLNEHGEGSQ
jgi:hypothetical protein